MKKLIALISVLMMSSMLFAESEWKFGGGAGLRATFKMTQPSGDPKPAATNDLTWDAVDMKAEANVTNGNISGYAKLSAEGDVWASVAVSDAFTIKMGKFGRQGYKVGGSKGPYHLQKANFGPGGGGQLELLFTADPSKFYISLYNMKTSADRGKDAISTVKLVDKKLVFSDVEIAGYDAFIPEIGLTYAFSNEVFSASAGGVLHTFKVKPALAQKIVDTDTTDIKRDTVQLTSFGAGVKIGITAGIFSLGVAGCYVVNPGVIGGVGDKGYSKLSYPLDKDKGALVNNNFIGFAADIDLKLGETVSTEVGFGYGFNTMGINGFTNDAHMSAHLNFSFTALEAIAMVPEVGFDKDLADYNGTDGTMTFYILLNNKISF